MPKVLVLVFPLLLAAAALIACGGGHAQARFVHASPDAGNVDFAVDGVNQATNLAFPSTNGSYVNVASGNRDIEVRNTGTKTDLVNAPNVNLSGQHHYTIFFTGLTVQKLQAINQVTDDNSAPTSGNIKLRFFHASPSGPTHVDIYVVTPGTDISSLQPNLPSVAYQQASGYLNLAAATYEIILTAMGSKTRLIDNTPPAFTAGQIRTFVVLDVAGGGTLSTSLFELADLN